MRGLLHVTGMPALPEELAAKAVKTPVIDERLIGRLGDTELHVRFSMPTRPRMRATAELMLQSKPNEGTTHVIRLPVNMASERRLRVRFHGLLSPQELLLCGTVIGHFEADAYAILEKMIQWRTKPVNIVVLTLPGQSLTVRFRSDPHHQTSPMRLTCEYLDPQGHPRSSGVAIRISGKKRLVLNPSEDTNLIDAGRWLTAISENEAHIVAQINRALGEEP